MQCLKHDFDKFKLLFLDLAQYQISQVNKSLKSKFENNEEINSDHGHVHSKKKIITLDEILRKVNF